MTRSHPLRAAAKAVIAMAILAAQSQGNKGSIKTAMIKPVCDFATEMKKVTAFALSKATQLSTEITQLRELQAMATKEIQKKGGATTGKRRALVLKMSQIIAQGPTEIEATAAKAIKAAAVCANMAGRVEDFVRVLAQATSGSKFCLGTGGTAATAPSDIPCLLASNKHTAMPLTPDNNLPQIQAKHLAIKSAASKHGGEDATSSPDCQLTQAGSSHGGYLQTTAATANIVWANGLFKALQSDAAMTQSNWEQQADATMTGSEFKDCLDKLNELASAGVAYSGDIENLLKLGSKQASDIKPITIQEGEFGKNDPPTDTTITTQDLEKLAKDLNPETENASTAVDNQIADASLELLKEELATNITQCKLVAKTSAKENCEVTKPQPAKCDDKEQGECDKTTGCEWKDNTCKITEGAQKEEEKAKQETGKDGKPTSTCKKTGE
uniref:Variant surface glycoprotein 1287 n=1 Tax=Trypanosoma brucei TaxID=5691 RepID=M4SY66_9TRYP|nr:variant surface glycoprotein 1287 [Trypanosoma brucei]